MVGTTPRAGARGVAIRFCPLCGRRWRLHRLTSCCCCSRSRRHAAIEVSRATGARPLSQVTCRTSCRRRLLRRWSARFGRGRPKFWPLSTCPGPPLIRNRPRRRSAPHWRAGATASTPLCPNVGLFPESVEGSLHGEDAHQMTARRAQLFGLRRLLAECPRGTQFLRTLRHRLDHRPR